MNSGLSYSKSKVVSSKIPDSFCLLLSNPEVTPERSCALNTLLEKEGSILQRLRRAFSKTLTLYPSFLRWFSQQTPGGNTRGSVTEPRGRI